jgi:glutamate racemase
MIGLFDSGLGGLTVLKAVKEKLPAYDYLYLGDTLHTPYGNRSSAAVYDLTKNACDFLFEQGCKLIIIACNTATAFALRKLQNDYLKHRCESANSANAANIKENIIGVVRPVAEYFAENGGQKIGVIGTRGTVDSKIYIDEIKALNPKTEIFQQAAPLLVSLIEENYFKKPVVKKILRDYLNVLKLKKVDSLILACTHYPILIKQIRQIMGKKCFVPNPGEIVADKLVDYLNRHPEIEKHLVRGKKTRYAVTDLNDNFKRVATVFLKEKINIEKIIL